MMRWSLVAARSLALIVALSLCSGCVAVPLTAGSSKTAGLGGRWTGSWRSGPVRGNFALQLARGSGDRLTATAVWHGLPTVQRQFAGTLVDGQLILGDPKSEGLTLNGQGLGVGGFSLGLDLVGPYVLLVDGRRLEGTVKASKSD